MPIAQEQNKTLYKNMSKLYNLQILTQLSGCTINRNIFVVYFIKTRNE